MSSAGRRSAEYVRARELFQTGQFPCWLAYPGVCTGPGLTVDHDPPLRGRTEAQWRAAGGQLRPACSACQARQGAAIRNGTPVPGSLEDTTAWRW